MAAIARIRPALWTKTVHIQRGDIAPQLSQSDNYIEAGVCLVSTFSLFSPRCGANDNGALARSDGEQSSASARLDWVVRGGGA
jgi:hypothetical protein